MEHLLRAAQAMVGISVDPATGRMRTFSTFPPAAQSSPEYVLAAQKAARCLQLLKDMVVKCQACSQFVLVFLHVMVDLWAMS
jgi:hypothetical protein